MTPGTLAGFDSNSDDVTKDDEVYPNLRGRHLRMTPEALLAEWPVLHEQRHEDAGRVIRHRLLRSRPGLGGRVHIVGRIDGPYFEGMAAGVQGRYASMDSCTR